MNDYDIVFVNGTKFSVHRESVEVTTNTIKQAIKIAKAKLPKPNFGPKWHLHRVMCNGWITGFELTDLP